MPAQNSELVMLKDIELVSICEHHLLPFTGVAHIAYLPTDSIVGLGRLANLVEILSARPQLQEKLTNQIADAVDTALKPKGVLVVVQLSTSAWHHAVHANQKSTPSRSLRAVHITMSLNARRRWRYFRYQHELAETKSNGSD